jgi:cytochrome c553
MQTLLAAALALCRLLMGTVLVCALASHAVAADGPTGEQIYKNQCATCHGASGEGTKEHCPRALTGERSVAQLASLIAKTMPKDDPGACVGDDAKKVAAFIYDAFYSKAARERNKPRIELARLTVRQHQNSIADLIAGFRSPGKWDDQHGLRGEYFSSKGFQNKQRVFERLDAAVKFDFKDGSPDTEKIKPEEFAVRWQGAVFAPETGDYEFIIKSENGARMWVNDVTRPLIDAWVRSGKTVEERGTIRLLAGRAYPLRLEFYKSKEAKEKTAAIALEWKPPHGVAGPIPVRRLSPNRFPETLIVETAFPPDDRSLGWERATTVSKAWDQAATDAAVETARYVVAHLAELSGVRDDANDRGPKLREFCRRFAERTFRRPLTDEQKRIVIDHQFEAAADAETAIKRVVLLVLLSPRFLYREPGDSADAFDVACRLSFGLWDAPPDKELLAAAAAGKIGTRTQVAHQAERMLADGRAHAKLREFLLQWLKLDQAPELAKDAERFPDFDKAVVADLRTSLERFLEEVVWTGNGDFRRLFLAEELYLNGRLAKFYGADLPADADFTKVRLDPEQRAGVLTHPYLMATFGYTAASSPIHRGVFVGRGLLGVQLRPPQDAFTPLSEKLHPDLTTRERVTLQTKAASCQACHGIINPLGFTLEHFDAVGRYRDKDKNRAVDATGSYLTRKGETVKFDGARDLAKFLASNEEVQTTFVERLFQHLAKQPIAAYGSTQAADLRKAFVGQGYNIRKLVVEAVVTSALPGTKPKPPPHRKLRSGRPVG